MSNRICGYTVVAYPESICENWKTNLNMLNFGYAYALHDMDTDDNGEKKKPHMHFYFQGNPTKKQKNFIHEALNVHYGENVHSANGMFDYLTHKNNPDKYHYDDSIIKYSEKWCQELFDTYYQKDVNNTDLVLYIQQNKIVEYSDLLDSLLMDGEMSLFNLAKSSWVRGYLDSRRYKKSNYNHP